ncbi:PQQ-dependent sugar dehydrogenase [Yinghuangia sp. ASG 101]|uniref:PQQ-dependent sugar dehydrogenase n=1 Tax=Yinghuangia sp. ASG 101 TaxID=2896848 RepID=UPI001E5903FE|nr:PQQ-dependent sugar dehydrogenase [Yinghuangia sp. ASG 101]UGQ10880.1 PQQ-dependent sugar dehydrogenase [Yinghuangia sp. ASG 101]
MSPARRPRNIFWTFLLAALLAIPIAVIQGSGRASAAPALPAGFQLRDMPSGQSELLTDFAWTPDGGYFTTGKNGRVAWVSAAGVARTVAQLPVETEQDLGLVGLAVAHDYTTSRTVYITRVVTINGVWHLRLESWKVTGTGEPTGLDNSVIIIDLVANSNSHAITTVIAADDGTLWVSIGDSADYRFVDALAFRSQDLNTGYGKILHLYPDGRGVPGNPFYSAADPNSWRSRVYAYGFRSPFRFSLDPTTGAPIQGDVGYNTWEEVDIVRPGSNYGWPCWEGATRTPGYRDLDACKGVGTAEPLWTYQHGTMGTSVTGGVVYTGSSYPEAYRGAYFFGDYSSGRLYTLRYDTAGNLTRAPEPNGFGTGIGGPVKFSTAVNGDIVYADIGGAKLRRLVYAPGNRPPTAKATTTTDAATRTVTFDGGSSTDLDGDALTYEWDFGDGTSATGMRVSHQYAAPGTEPLTARLTVRDAAGATGTADIVVVPANNAPELTLTTPPAGTVFKVGEPVHLTATAQDAEDGPLTVTWSSVILHCSGPYCHEHPGTSFDGGTYDVPFTDHGDNTSLVLTASARDEHGVVASATYTAKPKLRTLEIAGATPAAVTVNAVAVRSVPITVGATVTVIAPEVAVDGVATFASWTDGAPRARELVMPDNDLTLTTTYLTPIDRRYQGDGQFRTQLGAPTGPETGDAALRYRDFAGGRAYWTPATGVHEVHGGILTDYLAYGGHVAFGAPTTDETATPDGVGRFNHFAGTVASGLASSYWSPNTGAHMIYGDIRTVWSNLGWELGPHGYPTTDELPTANGVGRYNNFQNGAIYWKFGPGAHSVYGTIFDRYAALGWDSSVLGFPTTNETATPYGAGRYNHFEYGSIYWSSSTGAHEVYGSIRDRWSALGWELSYLGYPTSGEFAIPGGRRSNFQYGYIEFNAATGAVVDRRY